MYDLIKKNCIPQQKLTDRFSSTTPAGGLDLEFFDKNGRGNSALPKIHPTTTCAILKMKKIDKNQNSITQKRNKVQT